MCQRGRASREADCRRMRVLRHVVWGGLPGESKGLSYSRGEDARRRSCGDLQTVLVDPPLPWPSLRDLAGTAAESRSKKHACDPLGGGRCAPIHCRSERLARRLSLVAGVRGQSWPRRGHFRGSAGSRHAARACAVEGGQQKVGLGRPFAGAVLGPPQPCDARACACITWRERASRVGVYVASRKDTHHGSGEGQNGAREQGDLPPAEQVVEPTRRHRPHCGQQIAYALRHA